MDRMAQGYLNIINSGSINSYLLPYIENPINRVKKWVPDYKWE